MRNWQSWIEGKKELVRIQGSGEDSDRRIRWERRIENREEDNDLQARLRRFRTWVSDRFEGEGERDERNVIAVRGARKGEELDTEVEDATIQVVVVRNCDAVEEVGKVLQNR